MTCLLKLWYYIKKLIQSKNLKILKYNLYYFFIITNYRLPCLSLSNEHAFVKAAEESNGLKDE